MAGDFSFDQRYFQTLEITEYDPDFLPVEWHLPDDQYNAVIRDPVTKIPVCTVANARKNEIAYSSFENADQGGWTYMANTPGNSTSTFRDLQFPSGKTGYNSLALSPNIITRLLQPGDYRLSFWMRGSSGNVQFILPSNITKQLLVDDSPDARGWKYQEYTLHVDAPANSIIIPATGNELITIDELRLYPINARMTTRAFYSDGKAQCENDINNYINYFFYDDASRNTWTVNHRYDLTSTAVYHTRSDLAGDRSSVKTYEALQPALSASAILGASINSDDVAMDISYFDGLNRTIQSIAIQQSPKHRNIVSVQEFDALNRQPRKYLPFTHQGGQSYMNNALTYLSQFYNSSPHIAHTAFPWSETVFEDAPSSRLIEDGAPGESWQPGSGNTARSSYMTNNANEVLLWVQDGSSFISGNMSNPEYWPAHSLIKVESFDEGGHKQIIFQNTMGQVVMRRTFSPAGTSSGGDYYTTDTSDGIEGNTTPMEWEVFLNLDTYYFYDDFGRLICELPPALISRIEENSYFLVETEPGYPNYEEFYNTCFAYEYDKRGRTIRRKMPGMEWTYILYNNNNQEVMRQDSHERESDTWDYIKYDVHGRVVLTGRITLTETFSNLQEYWEQTTIPLYEIRSNAPGNFQGYTSNVFPAGDDHVLTVNYYDDYNFENTLFTCEDPSNWSKRCLNRCTGNRTRVLDSEQFLLTVTYYDKNGHPMQSSAENMVGGYSTSSMKYDFKNRVTEVNKKTRFNGSTDELTILQRFEYDKVGRMLRSYQKTGSDPEIMLNKFHYNELGQLVKKEIHIPEGLNLGMQTIDFRYNERGWLKSINNKELAVDGDNLEDYDVFGEELVYTGKELLDDPVHELSGTGLEIIPQFDGKIAMMEWKVKDPDVPDNLYGHHAYIFRYDGLGRMTNAVYSKYDPATFTLSLDHGHYTEKVDYDMWGNILHLKRNRPTDAPGSFTDDLSYVYENIGNRLLSVTEAGSSTPGDGYVHFIDGTNTGVDYTYDTKGRLISDLNKGLSYAYGITGQIANISYTGSTDDCEITYDASGVKLKLQVGDEITYFIGNAEYDGDGNLIMMITNEGCVRPTPEDATNTTEFVYDYHLKDHLGNIRVTITEENATEIVEIATLELPLAMVEELQFENIVGPGVTKPYDWYNVNEFNQRVARLSSSGYVVGPSHLSKVRLGEKVEVRVESFFTEDDPGATTGETISEILGSMLVNLLVQGPSILPSGESGIGVFANANSGQSHALADFLLANANQFPDYKPKAALIYVFLDKRLQLVREYSGIVPAGDAGAVRILQMLAARMPADGYFYTCVVNTSEKKVYFNDLTVIRKVGMIRTVNDYYPYGLTWMDILDEEQNNAAHQGKDFQQKQWDQHGTDMYDFHARMLDPVIARWICPDPVAQHQNGYQSMAGNPVLIIDPSGLTDEDGWVVGENGEAIWSDYVNSELDWELYQNGWLTFLGDELVGAQGYLFQSGLYVVDGEWTLLNNDGTMSPFIYELPTVNITDSTPISMDFGPPAGTEDYVNEGLELGMSLGIPVYFIYEALTPYIYRHAVSALTVNPRWTILHYNGGGVFSKLNRKLSFQNKGPSWITLKGWWTEEFPPACTREGGSAAWLTVVPFREQLIQGGQLSAVTRGMKPGDAFLVVPVPLMNDPNNPAPAPEPAPVPSDIPVYIPFAAPEMLRNIAPTFTPSPVPSFGLPILPILIVPELWTEPWNDPGWS
jgi:RHS repeat-associated protein